MGPRTAHRPRGMPDYKNGDVVEIRGKWVTIKEIYRRNGMVTRVTVYGVSRWFKTSEINWKV